MYMYKLYNKDNSKITIITIIVARPFVVVVVVVDEMPGFLLEHLTFPDLPVSAVPDLDKATHPDLCQSQSPHLTSSCSTNTEDLSISIWVRVRG